MSTVWTTGCCPGRTCTPCSIAGTLPLIPGTGYWSVSPWLREDFGNGDQFYARAGEVIELPERRADRPDRGFLEWHLDEVFKAS